MVVVGFAGPLGGAQREAHRAGGRAAELERGVEAGQQAEKAAAKEAERAQRAAEAERRQLEKGLDGEGGRVGAVVAGYSGGRGAGRRGRGHPPPDLRADARRYLQGRLQPAYELMAPETPLAARDDGAANTWLAAQVAAAQVAQLVHEQIGLGELYSRVDAVEVECWAGFISRGSSVGRR